jgi:hypothetical protein
MGHLAVSTLAALMLATAPAPESKPEEKDPTKPMLVVRSLDEKRQCIYLVHAVPQLPSGEAPFRPATDLHPPLQLVHTSALTGEMTRLVASGHSAVLGPPMNIDRAHHTRTTIAGVTWENGYLYVVLHTAKWTVTMPNRNPEGAVTSKHELLVFRLADAKRIHTLEIKDGDFPKDPPHDTCERGPLEVGCRGVACYGVMFEFKGEKVEEGFEMKKE